MKLDLRRVLSVDPGAHPRRQRHLSSASGLVCRGETAFVVADDELHLGVFSVSGDEDGRLLRLFDGDLSSDPAERKAAKPDLECLFEASFPGAPRPALVAFGSGSRDTRQRAVWVALDASGLPQGRVCSATLAPLYAPLQTRFADLNIEGGFVAGGRLRLLQRGHAGAPENASIVFDWGAVSAWLAGDAPAPAPLRIDVHPLGDVDGVPLCFTDATALEDGAWVFCAVAEATASSYLDGACVGAAIGQVDADGRVQRVCHLDRPWKVEGISAERHPGGGWTLRLVTDADDPSVASTLLQAHWA